MAGAVDVIAQGLGRRLADKDAAGVADASALIVGPAVAVSTSMVSTSM
jgi:hypothetical protein